MSSRKRTRRRPPAEPGKPKLWMCPGPEWPPEEETCGKLLPHKGRCPECSARRTFLRKQERAASRQKQGASELLQWLDDQDLHPDPWNTWD